MKLFVRPAHAIVYRFHAYPITDTVCGTQVEAHKAP